MGTIDIQRFRELLRKGEVNFSYKKIDGTIREARGTLDFNMIPEESHPIGTGKATSDSTISYFDLDKNAWRSLRTDNLISFGE